MAIYPGLLYPGADDAYPGYYTRPATYEGEDVINYEVTETATYDTEGTWGYGPVS